VVLVAVGVGLLVAVVVVPGGDDAATTTASVYHRGDTVTVASGDEFVVALPANPSTGSAWTADDDAT
jgi:predicted secreted protein